MLSGATFIYAWVFLIIFLAAMVYIGWLGLKKTRTADDFATARSSYNPVVLGLAISATAASGSTFMGMPGLAYDLGAPSLWYPLLFPVTTVFGMLLAAKFVKRFGDRFGTRTITEFIGERYDSDALRLILAAISLFLIFYVVAQFVAAATMFQTMLGTSYVTGLFLTGFVLAVYVYMGGSHSDIMTDSVQAALMLGIAVVVVIFFVTSAGFDGGFMSMLDTIAERRPEGGFGKVFIADNNMFGGPWLLVAILIAHIPFGMLPHTGNKFMAVKTDRDLKKLIMTCTIAIPTLTLMPLGGMLGIAVIDPAQGIRSDQVIPVLFDQLLPPAVSAFFAIAVLSAILSTSDGLVVSLTQVFANDIFRKSIAPRMRISAEQADRIELRISRYATLAVLIAAIAIAWNPPESLAIFLWIGLGGLISGIAGPLCLGTMWRRATRVGALASALSGGIAYWVVYLPIGFGFANPFGAAAIAVVIGMTAMVAGSLLTRAPSDVELARMFGPSETEQN